MQATQITQQAQREKDSFIKERSNLESMLQRVWLFSLSLLLLNSSTVLFLIDLKKNKKKKLLAFFFLSVRRKKIWCHLKENMLISPGDEASLWERWVRLTCWCQNGHFFLSLNSFRLLKRQFMWDWPWFHCLLSRIQLMWVKCVSSSFLLFFTRTQRYFYSLEPDLPLCFLYN